MRTRRGAAGEHTSTELAELFGLARSTVYRVLKRAATGIAGRRSVTA
jgi:predicted transcriptional regulator